ncbi:MAG: tetrahydrofolate synthase [Spirochaetaceae bacterium]|nr:tetrahydrofolate synthase [Spirochaetaceae bacterium]
MGCFSSAEAVFAYLDQFISADVWAIPKHLRAERLALLAEAGGCPEKCAPAFHVAGSKGKGSVTGMIAAALDAAGWRVMWYMSPHVADVRERIMLGRGFLDEAVYTDCGEEVQMLRDRVCDTARPEYRLFHGKEENCYPPTYFELLTSYYFFCARKVGADMQVVETGMGGRFDPTNIIDPLVSVISVIELEHTAFLGNTLAEIAYEKAGIIKPGKPVVLAEQHAEALPVFEKMARERNAPLFYLPDLVSIENIRVSDRGTRFTLVPKNRVVFAETMELGVGIPGAVQAKNAALAVAALKIAAMAPKGPSLGPLEYERAAVPPSGDGECGVSGISDDVIAAALGSFLLPARFEKVADDPPVVVDGAHTALSVELAVREWAALYGEGGILLFGCAKDKNVTAMARALLPHFSRVVITAPGSSRASRPQAVFDVFTAETARINPSCKITLVAGTQYAVAATFAESRERNVPFFCTGSFYLAAEAREQVLRTSSGGN